MTNTELNQIEIIGRDNAIAPKALTPGWIGRVKFPNRIMFAPMVTCLAGVNHEVTELLVQHYVRIARGGVGAIIVESTLVNDNDETMSINELHLSDGKYIPGMTRLAEGISEAGSVPILQINSHDKYSPDMTVSAIDKITEDFGKAAKRAKLAGFKAVEIHSCHNNFCSDILSPLTNLRDDKYGGDIKRNTKFVAECIRQIKAHAGRGFPVIVRYNGHDFIEGGIDLAIAKEIGSNLEVQGADALHITAGLTDKALHIITPYARPPKGKEERSYSPGWLIKEIATEISKEVSIPVIGVNRVDSMELANEVLVDNDCEFVAIGRALLANPNMVNESKRSSCLYINYCTKRVMKNKPIGCVQNKEIGDYLSVGKFQ